MNCWHTHTHTHSHPFAPIRIIAPREEHLLNLICHRKQICCRHMHNKFNNIHSPLHVCKRCLAGSPSCPATPLPRLWCCGFAVLPNPGHGQCLWFWCDCVVRMCFWGAGAVRTVRVRACVCSVHCMRTWILFHDAFIQFVNFRYCWHIKWLPTICLFPINLPIFPFVASPHSRCILAFFPLIRDWMSNIRSLLGNSLHSLCTGGFCLYDLDWLTWQLQHVNGL